MLEPNGNFAAFRRRFRGDLFRDGDEGYDEARQIWNAMIDKRPAVIARCYTAADVVDALTFARDQGLLLAIRSGGHNIAGHALCDDGMVIDLSQMRNAEVDVPNQRVTIEAGATLGDLDRATQVHGLATPVGINSTTGLAGLTLGGGFGWLSRKYGMTVDNLESAEVVTATGEIVRASETSHPDLFWALRGGGGNFGVVTRFEYRLHPVGPEVLAGLVVYAAAEAKTVLQQYRDFMATAPDELTVWAVMRQAPPLPFLPESVHGQPVVVLALFYAGTLDRGRSLIEPLYHFGRPLGDHVGMVPYVEWQQAFDPLLTPGARNYWKSHNFTHLEDGLFNEAIKALETLPSAEGEIFIAALGGATARVAPDAMAYAHRDAQFVMNVHSRWRDPADDAACITWAREFYAATLPYASSGAYINFMTADEQDRVQSAYGGNYGRLVEIKRSYDPHNLFRVNQNLRLD